MPNRPLMLWWALAAVAAIALVYAIVGIRKNDRSTAAMAIVVAAGAGIAGYAMRATKYQAPNLPIYSYGVMLGLSLVVGWYLTLKLAENDRLPKETMANCYVITALAALFGSRVLYVVTNPDEFKEAADFFALRRGGLVAYGGFLGGYLGSWLFLQRHKIRLLPWADVAVPSLASGLMITRIGCYLFGCDFGKRLPETAPAFLKKIGTFPHWASGTLEGGDGSPAFVKHMEAFRGTPMGAEVLKANASLPVHPTQIYESLVGLLLLVLLLWQRKHQKFRGQIFFLFAFGYGYLRFLLEIIRDDSERGEYGPSLPEHVFVAGSLFALGLAFVFGISLGISNARARTVARALAIVPPIVAYVMLRPPSFGKQNVIQLSTSQWIGLLSALVVSYFYAKFWEQARKAPAVAMSLESLGEIKPSDGDERRGRAEDDEDEEAPKKRKKKGLKKRTAESKSEANEDDAKAAKSKKAKADADDEDADDEDADAKAKADADDEDADDEAKAKADADDEDADDEAKAKADADDEDADDDAKAKAGADEEDADDDAKAKADADDEDADDDAKAKADADDDKPSKTSDDDKPSKKKKGESAA
ncbi:MAG: prolipoprotein diacylglyceryl transferase [Polyangiaceae bacterium]